jgi:hypothetical protein
MGLWVRAAFLLFSGISLTAGLHAQTVDDLWFDLGGSASPRVMALGIAGDLERSRRLEDFGIDAAGSPVIGTRVVDEGIEIWRWSGTVWDSLVGLDQGWIGVHGEWSSIDDMAFDSQGRVVVVWADSGINVLRWSGVAWEELGSSWAPTGGISEGYGHRPCVLIDPDDRPVVAWISEDDRARQIHVKRWDGSQWVEIGEGSGTEAGISDSEVDCWSPLLHFDPLGRLVIVWEEEGRLIIRRWNEVSWEDVPESGSGQMVTEGVLSLPHHDFTFDGNGWPVIAWVHRDGAPPPYGDAEQIYLRRWNGTAWVELSGSATGGGLTNHTEDRDDARDPVVVVDSLGRILVAWTSDRIGLFPQICIARWNGASWEEIGAGSTSEFGVTDETVLGNASPYDLFPLLCLDDQDRPLLVWGYDELIIARRWTGSEWVPMGEGSETRGGISRSRASSITPSLAIDSLGHPVVAWTEEELGTSHIAISRWTGAEWQPIGQGLSSATLDQEYPSLAVGPSDELVVAWKQELEDGENRLYLSQWDGMDWAELGGSATGDGLGTLVHDADAICTVVDSEGRPIVAWANWHVDAWDIFLLRWSGDAWEELDGSGSGGGVSGTGTANGRWPWLSLALGPDDHPFVAWEDRSIYLRRWTGTEWEELGGSASGQGVSAGVPSEEAFIYSVHPSVAIDASGETYVAWRHRDSRSPYPYDIYLRHWTGSQWEELGGSSSEGGISGGERRSHTPSVALDPEGHPIVAWIGGTEVDDRTQYEIFIRRWDGSQWAEVSEGSAQPDGISGPSGSSIYPQLRVGPDGVAHVAWERMELEIFLRAVDLGTEVQP